MLKWLKALRGLPFPRFSPANPPAESLGVFETCRFVVLDLETTGLNPQMAEILALGAIRMQGARILVGETFYHLVRPEGNAWPETVPLHQILPDDVSAAPPLLVVLEEFLNFCADSTLVGYGVALDRAFLDSGKAEALAPHLWLDVRQAARWLAAQRPPASQAPPESDDLTLLAHHYGIPIPVKHHALADAFVTAQIWQRQLAHLQALGYTQLPQLARVAGV
jgi:DNA polymerase-3 subunit epsilon